MPYFYQWNPVKQKWEATPELRQLLEPVYGDELRNHPLFADPPKQHGKRKKFNNHVIND